MFIVDKNRISITNIDFIVDMYIGSSGNSIKADFSNGNGCQIARYSSSDCAKVAFEYISKYIESGTKVIYAPDDDKVRTLIQNRATIERSSPATGHKFKRRFVKMDKVIIAVDGSVAYAKVKFEHLKKMLEGTDVSIKLTTQEIESLSGEIFKRGFLKFEKGG